MYWKSRNAVDRKMRKIISVYRNCKKIIHGSFSNQPWYSIAKRIMNGFVRPLKNTVKDLISAVFQLVNVQVIWEEYSATTGLNSKRFLIIRGFEGPSFIGVKHYVNRKRIVKNISSNDRFTTYTQRIVDGCGKERIPISIAEAAIVADGSFEVYRRLNFRSKTRSHLIGSGGKVATLPLGFDHFGHFIYQVLPLFLREENQLFAMDIVRENDKNRIIEILDFFDISHKSIDSRTKPWRVQFAAKQEGLYPGLRAAELMASRVRAKKLDTNGVKHVFLTRRHAPQGRSVSNEYELIEELKKFDFQIVDPGTLTFREQMSLFSSAKVVIGAHGSALANIIAMRTGSAVIELAGENYIRWHVKKLAADMDLMHTLLICESDEQENFNVNMMEFRKILKESMEFTGN